MRNCNKLYTRNNMDCVSEKKGRFRLFKMEWSIWAFVFLRHVKATAANKNKIRETKERKIRKQ